MKYVQLYGLTSGSAIQDGTYIRFFADVGYVTVIATNNHPDQVGWTPNDGSNWGGGSAGVTWLDLSTQGVVLYVEDNATEIYGRILSDDSITCAGANATSSIIDFPTPTVTVTPTHTPTV